MAFTIRSCNAENDYFLVRNFLREVFLLNNRLEHSWQVARLDYWRWHFIATCQITPPFEQVAVAWETASGELVAVLHPFGDGEIRLHIHPRWRSPELEAEAFTYAVEHYAEQSESGARLIAPVFADDALRQQVLTRLGFSKREGWNHHYWRDLDAPMAEVSAPPGYLIRSMGDESEHPSRSWCSWRAFHSDEPASNYDGDFSWFHNLQSAPLYRRDLDIVAAALNGEIAAFCTIYYDDYTRSAVTVLVGVAAEHWRRGLGKAIILEGMRRLKHLGCTRVFSTANDEPADALYRSVMTNMKVTDTWIHERINWR
ncbi:MAG: GNAT family N-acetyltransferase [Anaerolineales bacterium]|nr:GNAT family N-acetyltransferase [Anaerolineales bacterium]